MQMRQMRFLIIGVLTGGVESAKLTHKCAPPAAHCPAHLYASPDLKDSRPMLKKSLLACLCVALIVSSAAADNWPRFRGPNGVGVAKDTSVPVQFDAKSVLW